MIIVTSGGPTTYSMQDQLWGQTQFLGLYPAGPLKLQRMDSTQPLLAACSVACLPSWRGKCFLHLQFELPLFQLMPVISPLPTMRHSETLAPSSLKPPRSGVQGGCSVTSSPKPFLLQDEQVPVPQPLLTGQLLLQPIWGPPTELIPDGLCLSCTGEAQNWVQCLEVVSQVLSRGG